MPLSNIIERAIELNTIMGITQQSKAKRAAIDLIATDGNATREAVDIAVTKLIHDQATRTMRKAGADGRQGSLFGLRTRYALEDLGHRVIKDTDRLTRDEFDQIIQIREKQLVDDKDHLDNLRAARRQLAPIWEEYPHKLFREVEAIYLSHRVVDA